MKDQLIETLTKEGYSEVKNKDFSYEFRRETSNECKAFLWDDPRRVSFSLSKRDIRSNQNIFLYTDVTSPDDPFTAVQQKVDSILAFVRQRVLALNLPKIDVNDVRGWLSANGFTREDNKTEGYDRDFDGVHLYCWFVYDHISFGFRTNLVADSFITYQRFIDDKRDVSWDALTNMAVSIKE